MFQVKTSEKKKKIADTPTDMAKRTASNDLRYKDITIVIVSVTLAT